MKIRHRFLTHLLTIFLGSLFWTLSFQSLAMTLTEVSKLTTSVGALSGLATVDDDTIIVTGRLGMVPGSSSAHVFTRTADVWTEQAILKPDNSNDPFCCSLSIDGDTALIGAPYGHEYYDVGTAYVFLRTGETWTQQAKLRASGWVDIFANSVSVDGDTAVVGGILDDQPGHDGSAYVFLRDNDIWTEQAILKPSGSTGEDQGEELFGNAVAIDSDTILVGHGFDWDNHKRVVYVFTRTDGVWTEQAKLMASDNVQFSHFGYSVALDGDIAVIGDPNCSRCYSGTFGRAYVFKRTKGIWTEQAIITPSVSEARDDFGGSVSISGDTVVIGSYGVLNEGKYSGSAYVFRRNNDVWTEQAILAPSDLGANDYFGASVSVSGETATVGAYEYSEAEERHSGAVYVFSLSKTVPLDIMPHKKTENIVNLTKGKNIKVAIIGGADFDALQVDPSTVKLGPSKASPIRDKGKDYNKDGFSDLVLTFNRDETGIACGDSEATLTGQTFPEPVIYITGSDTFTVEPCP